MSNDYDFSVNEIKTTSFSNGCSWVVTAVNSILKKNFWVMFAMLFLVLFVSGFVPFVGGLVEVFGLFFCYAMYIDKKIEPEYPIDKSGKFVLQNYMPMIFYWLLNIVLRYGLYFILLIVMLIVTWDSLCQIFDFFSTFIEQEKIKYHLTLSSMFAKSADINVIGQIMSDFYAHISSNAHIFALILLHFCYWTLASLVLELIIYMANFFTIPLILYSKMPVRKAMWSSFVAFNKNIWSITGMGLAYLLVMILPTAILLLLLYCVSSLGIAFIGMVSITSLLFISLLKSALIVFNTIMQAEATKNIYWHNN